MEHTTSGMAEITVLLREWGKGEDHALHQLLPLVYEELHALAKRVFSAERGENVLQTTALVHEVYMRLVQGGKIQCESRVHFFALASRMMRRILVEHARKRLAQKRGGEPLITIDESMDSAPIPGELRADTVLLLDKAISCLDKSYPRAARVLEWKVFGELEHREIGEVMGLSTTTVKREWARAKQQLFLVLKGY